MCDTPTPESIAMPVVRPEADRDTTWRPIGGNKEQFLKEHWNKNFSVLQPSSRDPRYICRLRHVLAQTVARLDVVNSHAVQGNCATQSDLRRSVWSLPLILEVQGMTLARLLVRSQTGRKTDYCWTHQRKKRESSTQNCARTVFAALVNHSCEEASGV